MSEKTTEETTEKTTEKTTEETTEETTEKTTEEVFEEEIDPSMLVTDCSCRDCYSFSNLVQSAIAAMEDAKGFAISAGMSEKVVLCEYLLVMMQRAFRLDPEAITNAMIAAKAFEMSLENNRLRFIAQVEAIGTVKENIRRNPELLESLLRGGGPISIPLDKDDLDNFPNNIGEKIKAALQERGILGHGKDEIDEN